MWYWLVLALHLFCGQVHSYDVCAVALSADQPCGNVSYGAQNSKIIKKLLAHESGWSSRDLASCSYHAFVQQNTSCQIFDNVGYCRTWKVIDYWNAMLELFGRAYPLGKPVDLPAEYKCFCTDGAYAYYIHDAERYAIMEQWHLYENPAFWSFIRHYPDYEQCIMAMHDVIEQDLAVRRQLSDQAIGRIKNEARNIEQKRLQQGVLIQEGKRLVMRELFATCFGQICQDVAEYDDLILFYKNYNCGDSEFLAQRKRVIEEIQHRGLVYTTSSYQLSDKARVHIRSCAGDDAAYEKTYGNQLQQLVHRESLDLLEEVASMCPDSVVYAHRSAMVDCLGSVN